MGGGNAAQGDLNTRLVILLTLSSNACHSDD